MMLLKIYTNPAYAPEKRYVFDVLCRLFLGISYEIVLSEEKQGVYKMVVNGKAIVFPDIFFSKANMQGGYLFEQSIPGHIQYANNDFLPAADLPVIYGTDLFEVDSNSISCGVDIVGSIFFMLTRWEEYVLKERDYLNRFPAEASLAFRAGFLQRPIVNEMAVMLQRMWQHLEPTIVFTPAHSYELFFTHDIDFLNAPVTAREFAKDIIRRKSLRALQQRVAYWIKRENPYDLFDFFMDISEQHHTVSRFYFMTGHNLPGKDGEAYNDSPFYKKVLQKIRDRGHVIGFHPSLLTYNDPGRFLQEKRRLEKDADMPITEGRQHALRFEMPFTWRLWNDAGMQLDSTLGYSAQPGFRCGTGCRFPVFDFLNRTPLGLQEQPLIVMDTTLHVNQRLSLPAARDQIAYYQETGKRYHMPVTFLFHNLLKDTIDWPGWMDLYREVF